MIQIDHLTKRFGPLAAVDDLSVRVEPGRVTGLLGPNGAGKTTTMSIVLGLQRPTSGRTLVDGRPYASLQYPLREVGALLDADGVHPARTARAHLTWIAQTNNIAGAKVNKLLQDVGLEHVADKEGADLWLGMERRPSASRGRSLGDAPVLIFDEATNGLDPEGIEWLRGFLKQLAHEGRTVLVSSHLMGEMSLTAGHLIVIGAAASSPTPRCRLHRQPHPRRRLRTNPTPEQLAQRLRTQGGTVTPGPGHLVIEGLTPEVVGETAAQAGIVLHELRTRTATLEDAYLALTRDSVQFGSHHDPGPLRRMDQLRTCPRHCGRC